jgi:hypothetical protein
VKMLGLLAKLHFLLLVFLLAGCGRRDPGEGRIYRMGERAVVGTVTYSVIEANWSPHLGDGAGARLPQHQFMTLRLSVTNGGAGEINLPLLELENSKGETFMELQNGEGVTDWLGIIRKIKPAETAQGAILFDAPKGSYRLRITDAADIEYEKISRVDIPMQLDTPAAPMGGIPAAQ